MPDAGAGAGELEEIVAGCRYIGRNPRRAARQEERRRHQTGQKNAGNYHCRVCIDSGCWVCSSRFIINAVQKHNQSDDASLSVSSSSQVDDSSTPDATAAETTEKAAAGDAEIVSITPDETYLAVLEDGTATIKVSLSAHGAANGSSLQWTSSDEKIATVDENGAVKGVAAGTCTISVSAKNDPSVSADVDVAVRHLEEKDGCTYVDGILIVNKTYSLPESYDPQGLTPETQTALDEMIADAYAAGLNLYDASVLSFLFGSDFCLSGILCTGWLGASRYLFRSTGTFRTSNGNGH